jgi:hypothetical protein
METKGRMSFYSTDGEIKVECPITEKNVDALILILEGMKEEMRKEKPKEDIQQKDVRREEQKTTSKTKVTASAEHKKEKKVGKEKKKYKKRTDNKWTPEVFDFVKKNLHLKNREIAEAINKKFKINTTEGSLGVQMAHHGIKRKEIHGKAREPDMRKMNKGNVKALTKFREDKGMSKKEISASLRDMGADDDDAVDEFSDEEDE